jgi:hypothetical protein
MADIFEGHLPRLESPLNSMEIVTGSYATDGYIFNQTPRAINCSSEGTLIVRMSNSVTASLYVNVGLNPYRVEQIYSGSSAGTIVGLY